MDVSAVFAGLAGAVVGASVTFAGTWLLKDQKRRRKGAVLARQAVLMASSLATMFMIVEEKAATNFDVQRLRDLVHLLSSPDFLEFVSLRELLKAYSALATLEVEQLQYERIYGRFQDLHGGALLGHLSEDEAKELESIEAGLRVFANRASKVLKEEVAPELMALSRRLSARAQSAWDESE